MKIKLNKYALIVWCYVLLETFHFAFGGGNFRVYFFISLTVLFVYMKGLGVYRETMTFRMQMFFVLTMFVSAIVSPNIKGAFFSMCSCVLYLMTSWVIAQFLLRRRLSVERYMDLLLKIAFAVVAFGLIQYLVFRTTGIALTYQGSSQLAAGQIPGVSIEANGHGKMVGFAIVIAIPCFLRSTNKKEKKRAVILLVMGIITLIISMTRMVLYALIIVFVSMTIYYLIRKKTRNKITILMMVSIFVIGIVLYLVSEGIIDLGSYSSTKLNDLFYSDYASIKEDDSGGTRLKIIEASIQTWLQSFKTFMIGSGMGQAYINDNGVLMRVAATGIISTLPSIGLIGEIGYVGMLLSPLLEARKTLKVVADEENDGKLQFLAEQTIFLSIYIIAMDFFASTYVYAEMWFVVALGLYWGMYNANYINKEDLIV